jgi:hypothetical protein
VRSGRSFWRIRLLESTSLLKKGALSFIDVPWWVGSPFY